MMTKDETQYRQRLDAMFRNRTITEGELELQGRWAEYLCVLVSGYLETSIKSIIADYATKKSDARVARFVRARLADFQNPKMQKILDLISSLDQDWGHDLEAVAQEKLKDTIDTIVANRNHIAHGKMTNISLKQVSDLYEDAKKLVVLVQDLCDGKSLPLPAATEVAICPTCGRKIGRRA